MSTSVRIFIASSSEALPVAEAVNIKLDDVGRVKLWDNAFDLSSLTLPSLLQRAKETDFAVFVFHPDDEAVIRGEKQSVVRDNVVFELGLFIGALGVEKCFVLVPGTAEGLFRLPSDLAGLTVTSYDQSLDDMVDAVSTSCAKIKQVIRRLSRQEERGTDAKGQQNSVEDPNRRLESELWSARIDLQRSLAEQTRLHAAIASHFYAIAKPATDVEVRRWEEGAAPNYSTPPKIARHRAYYVDADVIVPTLHGASSLAVIAEEGVTLYGLDQIGHNSVYFMDGFRMLGR